MAEVNSSPVKQSEPADYRRYFPTWALLLMMATFAIMIGHELEHIVQIAQKIILGERCPIDCHGIIGQGVDLEWLHFAYNSLTFVLLTISWIGLQMWRPEVRHAHKWGWWLLFIAIFAVQGFHMVEHSAKIGQWMINGHQSPTPGIIGYFLNPPARENFSLIEYHFILNTVVFVMVAIAMFIYRLPQLALKRVGIGHGHPLRAWMVIIILFIALVAASFLSLRALMSNSHSGPSHSGKVEGELKAQQHPLKYTRPPAQ